MLSLHRSPPVLAFVLFASVLSVHADSYQGFHIDYSQVRDSRKLEVMKAAMDRQVDMVAEVGLPPGMQSFFTNIPVVILAGNHPYDGHYDSRLRRIEITGQFLLRGINPTLLHELLHAYHDQKLGFQDPTIIGCYRIARQKKLFEVRSHMMYDAEEYFACAGTTYLFGVTDVEPFNRQKVKTLQPYFYQYLEQLFGPDAGTYKGSLTEQLGKLEALDKSINTSQKSGA